MDVRLSPEQVALRESAAQVVDRLGPGTVSQVDDAERAGKLDAAVAAAGWRELRTATDAGTPWASAVEVAVIAEELGRGLADAAFLGPTLAADLRRRAGASPATSNETVALAPDLSRLAVADDEADATAVDAHGARAALLVLAAEGGRRLGLITLDSEITRTDLTRPVARGRDGEQPTAFEGQTRLLDDDDMAYWQSLGLAATCADLVGTMRGALALATEYAKERKQYGATI
ncbi:MAG TPA: hypothetical protein VHZ05_00605, partial [Acidimicrobiales bacterium]|nr:hypothetical protein [Acidimicrobiales bacterium]